MKKELSNHSSSSTYITYTFPKNLNCSLVLNLIRGVFLLWNGAVQQPRLTKWLQNNWFPSEIPLFNTESLGHALVPWFLRC